MSASKENSQPNYTFLSEQPVYPVRHGYNGALTQDRVTWRSIEDVEYRMIRDTVRIIESMDGTADGEGKQYLEGVRRYPGKCDAAIYLDKSARPVRALVSEIWNDISEESSPAASFLNIDKIDYLLEMGLSSSDIRNRYIPAAELSVKEIPEKDLRLRTAEIRSLYLADSTHLKEAEKLIEGVRSDQLPQEALDAIWDFETQIDNQHVAIVDEVRSSGATLTIADQLLGMAIPEAKFEPMFWSTPPTHRYDVEINEEIVPKLADTEKPLWYDSHNSGGRGGIGGKNIEYSGRSSSIRQRIGKHVLSAPYIVDSGGRHDLRGYALRKDIKILADRWRSGNVRQPGRRT